MAFTSKGTLDPHGAPVLRHEILANSVTYVVGDALKLTSGFPVLGTAATFLYGILEENETNKAVGLNTTGVAGAVIGSYVNSWTTPSTNQTVLMTRGVIDISRTTLYSAKVNATLGTTTGSNLLGYYLDLADETQLSESSTLSTTLQFFSFGPDLNSGTVPVNLIVSLHRSLIFGNDG